MHGVHDVHTGRRASTVWRESAVMLESVGRLLGEFIVFDSQEKQ
jgi:hypothetical protein